jgi:hypothetical protein
MSISSDRLIVMATHATKSNDHYRAKLETILARDNLGVTQEIHSLLSSLYARLGNDSMVINQLSSALKEVSN